MSLKLTISMVAFAALSAVAVSAYAGDHHCKLPDGNYDATKTQKQCSDAKGTWQKDATFAGTLKTGVAAIGGETTGIEIDDGKTAYELDLRGDKALLASADSLAGKRVTVTGYLTIKKGVEIAERHIIVVSTLAAAKK